MIRMSISCEWYIWQWCTSGVSASALQPNITQAWCHPYHTTQVFFLFHAFHTKNFRIRSSVIRKAVSCSAVQWYTTIVWNKSLFVNKLYLLFLAWFVSHVNMQAMYTLLFSVFEVHSYLQQTPDQQVRDHQQQRYPLRPWSSSVFDERTRFRHVEADVNHDIWQQKRRIVGVSNITIASVLNGVLSIKRVCTHLDQPRI